MSDLSIVYQRIKELEAENADLRKDWENKLNTDLSRLIRVGSRELSGAIKLINEELEPWDQWDFQTAHELIGVADDVAKLEHEAKNRWTSVKDKLPENDINILGSDGSSTFECHHYDDGAFDDCCGYPIKVTHWMPLPECPQC